MLWCLGLEPLDVAFVGIVTVELWILLAVFVALQIYAECRSLTEDIKRIPPLRWLDELGVRK